jgi:hypothetical protein
MLYSSISITQWEIYPISTMCTSNCVPLAQAPGERRDRFTTHAGFLFIIEEPQSKPLGRLGQNTSEKHGKEFDVHEEA